MLDRKTFYTYARRAPFGNRLTQQQIDGIEPVLDVWEERYADKPLTWLAYILATVFHETGGKMIPVREGFATTDAGARAAVAKLYAQKRISRNYALPGINGQSYYGRGRVQNTHQVNYAKLSTRFKRDFVNNPDLLLDSKTDALITVVGHVEGIWTGRKLEHYFTADAEDAIGARRIINGTDKAKLIASYYEQFKGALNAADVATPLPRDVPDEIPVDGTPPLKSTSILTVILTLLSSGGAAFLSSVNSPWALGALAIVAICGTYLIRERMRHAREGGV
jgi:predicted chitinase